MGGFLPPSLTDAFRSRRCALALGSYHRYFVCSARRPRFTFAPLRHFSHANSVLAHAEKRTLALLQQCLRVEALKPVVVASSPTKNFDEVEGPRSSPVACRLDVRRVRCFFGEDSLRLLTEKRIR